MRLHYLQHVPFEDAANIAVWATRRGHRVTVTRLDRDEPLPAQDAFDALTVMGGPMNIDQHDAYPWLVREKEFLRATIDRGAAVLGVCLGAQLISEVLGGTVTQNRQKEIGWFPVTWTEAAAGTPIFGGLPRQTIAFHWHGDTFSIPPGAVHLAASAGCDHQAFQYGQRVVGLQFHWDYTAGSVETMIRNCGDELIDAPGIQKPAEMVPCPARFREIQQLLDRSLDGLFGQIEG